MYLRINYHLKIRLNFEYFATVKLVKLFIMLCLLLEKENKGRFIPTK